MAKTNKQSLSSTRRTEGNNQTLTFEMETKVKSSYWSKNKGNNFSNDRDY